MPLPTSPAIVQAALLGGVLAVAGCSAPNPNPAPVSAPTAKPNASSAPVVQFTLPAEMKGLPRSTDAKWLKIPKSAETSLKRNVLRPEGDSIAAAYLDPDELSQTIELSAAAGRVVDPAGTLRRLIGAAPNLEDVRPADSGTVGGVGACGVSHELRPAVTTVCHWAEPGGVGWIRVSSLKDRRDWLADLRAQLQP